LRPMTKTPMALQQLDAFLAHAKGNAKLIDALQKPLALEEFLALARSAGYDLNEQDVLAAQAREDSMRSDAELQASAGQEARRLRSFIPG